MDRTCPCLFRGATSPLLAPYPPAGAIPAQCTLTLGFLIHMDGARISPCCTCSGPHMGLPMVRLHSNPTCAGEAGSEAVVEDPAGARRLCFAWHPRQDLSSSLWKQAAQCANPLSLGTPALLRMMVSLSPAPSPGCEAGDSDDCFILARCLGQGGGTCSPKALCGRWNRCPGVWGAVAGKHPAASGLRGDGASSRGAPKPPHCLHLLSVSGAVPWGCQG